MHSVTVDTDLGARGGDANEENSCPENVGSVFNGEFRSFLYDEPLLRGNGQTDEGMSDSRWQQFVYYRHNNNNTPAATVC